MTNPTTLSPAAQAVLDAVLQKSNLSPTVPVAAAALRAAADQVVPEEEPPRGGILHTIQSWSF